jgi:dihydrofolate reductase
MALPVAETLDRRAVLRQIQQIQERSVGVRKPGHGRLPAETGLDSHRAAHPGQGIPKAVFSTSLTTAEGNARLARSDVADEVAGLKNQSGAAIASVGGARLAASLAEKDLIDEYRVFVSPVVLGGGTRYFPPLPKRLDLKLIEMAAGRARSGYGRGWGRV